MQPQPSIQMTLFDYFMDSDSFSLNEAVEAVKLVKEVKEPSVRGRIYEGIDKGLFERIGKGVYTVKRKNAAGYENSCLLVNGNGRDLSMFEDNSMDALITDHPYRIEKSLKGGNRDFASYDCFRYEQRDMDEKCRVLKPGCFLVEFLPEENADNYKYIYQIKSMAEQAGLQYFATVPWKKGDFVANTGRKSKNTEQVVLFTKGHARSLKLDAKKNKAMLEEMMVLHFEKEWENMLNEPLSLEIDLLVNRMSAELAESELEKAFENWMYDTCEDSILQEDYPGVALEQVPLVEYMLLWLDKKDIEYVDVTGRYDNNEVGLAKSCFADKTLAILKEIAPDRLFYMSGTNGMLPTVFDVPPVEDSKRIHQAEKPIELLEKIIGFVSLPNEKILDQFAGSGVTGEAALNTGRDSVLIEIDEKTFGSIRERVNKAKGR